MPTNQQRRDAERRRLQRQLEERRTREIARRRMTLIGSIIGTLVIVAAVVVIVVVSTGSSAKNKAGENDTITGAATPSITSTAAAAPVSTPTAPCAGPAKGTTATYQGVTVAGATNLKAATTVTSKATTDPATLQCEDLVVGTGKAAGPTSTVTVQYSGVLYKDGTAFDSSWAKGGQPAQFPLTGVVKGFTQGIGGAGKVAPMKVGGRRLMILPSSLGYGPQGGNGIPPNAPLVFIVDLISVGG